MMTNLFSVFDPSSSVFSFSWLILIFLVGFISMQIWQVNSPQSKFFGKVVASFKNEVKFALHKTEKGVELMIMLSFMIIIMSNFVALYPQVFSPTSHLTSTMPLSLTFWVSVMMFGWLKNTNHMLSHLLPQGTPGALMMFMVLIELTSNLIRPITLCVRLTANLIAGHLLMTLLGNALSKMTLFVLIPSMMIPIILTVLESAVACIQAYVFMTLITLYTTETKYDNKI